MRSRILSKLDDAEELESLYISDRKKFSGAFLELYPEIRDKPAAAFWYARISRGRSQQRSDAMVPPLAFVACICAITALLSRLPGTGLVENDFYYPRNAAFIFFPSLSAFFLYLHRTRNLILATGSAFLASIIFMNMLPETGPGDTLILSCIAMPLCAWFLAGCAFAGRDLRDHALRTAYLKFNADLLVMTTLILLSAMIMTGITIALFYSTGYNIEKFYMKNIAVPGIAMSPLIAAYLVTRNPNLVSRISPLLARFFSPLALITLLVYLPASLISGKDPYNDRDFLIVFNVALIAVLAIIFFCITGGGNFYERRAGRVILLSLAIVTILINTATLSAIIYRLAEMGFTPNRLAVLGSNVLMLLNLLLIAIRMIRSFAGKADTVSVPRAISQFMPWYFAWVVVVTFVFPPAFNFS